MEFEQFRRKTPSEIFDYPYLASCYGDIKKTRDKASALAKEGKIIRLKNGLYVFGEYWRQAPLSLEVISNLLYGPSIVSFESALTHYSLIAERARVVTCLAIGKSKIFDTAIGVFEYHAISSQKFSVGIQYIDLGKEGGYFIASKEKAISDLVYRTPGIRTKTQLRSFLFEEMRIDEQMFQELDRAAFLKIGAVYKKKSVGLLSRL